MIDDSGRREYFFDECKLVLPLVKLQHSLLSAKVLSIDALILSINVVHMPRTIDTTNF